LLNAPVVFRVQLARGGALRAPRRAGRLFAAAAAVAAAQRVLAAGGRFQVRLGAYLYSCLCSALVQGVPARPERAGRRGHGGRRRLPAGELRRGRPVPHRWVPGEVRASERKWSGTPRAGSGCRLRDCVVWDRVALGAGCRLERSVVCCDAALGPGCRLAERCVLDEGVRGWLVSGRAALQGGVDAGEAQRRLRHPRRRLPHQEAARLGGVRQRQGGWGGATRGRALALLADSADPGWSQEILFLLRSKPARGDVWERRVAFRPHDEPLVAAAAADDDSDPSAAVAGLELQADDDDDSEGDSDDGTPTCALKTHMVCSVHSLPASRAGHPAARAGREGRAGQPGAGDQLRQVRPSLDMHLDFINHSRPDPPST